MEDSGGQARARLVVDVELDGVDALLELVCLGEQLVAGDFLLFDQGGAYDRERGSGTRGVRTLDVHLKDVAVARRDDRIHLRFLEELLRLLCVCGLQGAVLVVEVGGEAVGDIDEREPGYVGGCP